MVRVSERNPKETNAPVPGPVPKSREVREMDSRTHPVDVIASGIVQGQNEMGSLVKATTRRDDGMTQPGRWNQTGLD